MTFRRERPLEDLRPRSPNAEPGDSRPCARRERENQMVAVHEPQYKNARVYELEGDPPRASSE